MAGGNTGELWFELGVRDRVQKALDADLQKIKQLEAVLNQIGLDQSKIDKTLAKAFSSANKAAEKYRDSLHKMIEARQKLQTAYSKGLSLGADVSKTEQALNRINGYFIRLIKAANKYGADSKQVTDILNANYSHVLRTMNGVYTAQERLNNSQARLNEKNLKDMTDNMIAANKGLVDSYDKVTRSGRQTMSTLSMLRQQAGYYFSLFGAKTLFENVVKIGGQFEYQHVALQNIIGDAEKATALFAQLKDLAVESPKTFMELTTSAKQLSAYQIPVNELYDTTKRLSDLSVGLGVDMNRLILAYGQVRSAAVLRGQELRQFTEAGIPLVQALAQKFTELNGKVTSTADVFKLIQTRAVSFDMVKEVLWDMTNQGGQFFNMQSTMADTLYGKWQKLADIWQITLGDMANTNFGGFKPFHALIDTLVFAARNLSNLMPILTGMMTAKGFAFIRSSAQNQFSSTGLEKNIAQAQKLQSIELRRAYVNGEISKKIYQQRMAMNANKDSYYMLLAAEGRISNYQIRRLIEEKKITAEKIRQGLANGTLIQQEAVQLRLLMQQNAQGKLGGMNGIARGIGGSILSFMGGWWGVALGVAGAAWSIYSNYKQKAEEEEAQAKERIKSAQELWKNADITLRAAVNEGASESAVNNMSQWLKENAASWDMVSESMKNNDGTAKTLEERYNILKDAIEGVKNASEQAAKGSNPFSGKEGNSVAEDLKDAQESLDDFQKVLNDKVALNYSRFKKAMDEVIAASPNFKKALEMEGATNSLTRQMEILQRFPLAFKQFRGIFSTEMNMLVPINEIRDAWTDFQTELQDAHDNLPNLAEKIEADMRNKWDDINFKNLTAEQREYLMKLYKDWLEKNNITSTAVLKDLDDKFLNKRYNIRLVFTAEQGNELNAFQKDALGYLGKGATPFKSGAVQRWTQGGSAYAASNMAQSEIDTAYKEWQRQEKMIKNLKKQGKEVSEEAESLKRSLEANYNDLVSAAWEGLGYQYEGKGLKSNKTPKAKGGGSKTDVVAKAMRERVSVLKDAYSEYKKWTELLGKEGALAKVKESGIFGSLFADKDFKGLGDYRGELQRIKSKLSPDKSEQRKVIESIDKILLGMDYDDAKEQAEKDIALLQSAMDKLGKAWDNYKSLYEKTGNKAFAELAFSGGTLWDEKASALAEELSKKANLGTIDFTMSEESAKDFFNYNTTEGKALFDLWKQITDLIRNNYTKALQDSASAMAELMTTADKITQKEQEIADLRAKGAGENDPRVIQNEKEIKSLKAKQFEESAEYLRFYSAPLSFAAEEAEKAGEKIKEKLVQQLADGVISADKYMKSMKNITQQLEKIRKYKGGFNFFKDGGVEGKLQWNQEIADDRLSASSIQVQEAEKELQEARLKGTWEEIQAAKLSLEYAKKGHQMAQQNADAANQQVESYKKLQNTMSWITAYINMITEAYDAWSNMAESLGEDFDNGNWDYVFEGLKGVSSGASAAMSGDFGGLASSLASTITGISKRHDKKRDKLIEKAQEQINAINRLTDIMERTLDRTLGGIYNYVQSSEVTKGLNYAKNTDRYDSYYDYRDWRSKSYEGENPIKSAAKEALESATYFDTQLALLQQEKAELQKQMEAEDDKKKKDNDKIEDYKASIIELEDKIKNFAIDLAKTIYDIDVKSWARELGDALVDAWMKGEDAAQAWSDKVKELISGVTKNIITQKIVETALQPVLDLVESEMVAKKGRLDESTVVQLAQKLEEAGNVAIPSVEAFLDAMKQAGYDLGSGGGSSSASQVLSGLSENDQSLLMSYVNAIRGDVSVLRTLAEQESGTLTGMNATVQLQLRELEAISVNTRRNADSAEFIEMFCRGLRDGEYTIKVK